MSAAPTQTVRLLFVDDGVFHHEDIEVPASLFDGDDDIRLIDLLREDPALLRTLHVDFDRLCSARVLEPQAP
jgi:hypothetical protein